MNCIKCRRQTSVVPRGGLYWCTHCKVLFDDDPNEGGPAICNDPVRNAIRKEEQAEYRIRIKDEDKYLRKWM